MPQNIKPLTESPASAALRAHYERIKDSHLRQLFADDPRRGTHFSAEGAGIYLDFSKNRITDETVGLLVALPEGSIDCRRRRECGASGPHVGAVRQATGRLAKRTTRRDAVPSLLEWAAVRPSNPVHHAFEGSKFGFTVEHVVLAAKTQIAAQV